MRYFKIEESTGLIQGATDADGEILQRNLRPGQVARPWRAGIDHKRHRWDEASEDYVPREVPPPEKSDDPTWMRETAYSEIMGDQMGAVMKVLEQIVSIPEVASALAARPEVLSEFNTVSDLVAQIKADNPIDIIE